MIHVALFGVALFFVVDFGVAREDDFPFFFVGGSCNSGDCSSSSGVDNCCNGCGVGGVGGASEGCCVSTCRSADGGGVTTGSGDLMSREVVLDMRAFFLRAGGSTKISANSGGMTPSLTRGFSLHLPQLSHI